MASLTATSIKKNIISTYYLNRTDSCQVLDK